MAKTEEKLPIFRILLVRHGESEANADTTKGQTEGDNAHKLTNVGHQQARNAGRFINAFFRQPEILAEHKAQAEQRQRLIAARTKYNDAHPDFVAAYPELTEIPNRLRDKPYVRLWNSPFTRTRETAEEIETHAKSVVTDTHENPFLYEMRYGLYDGLSAGERADQFPEADKHAKKYKDSGGLHWAVTPLGESQADVGERVREWIGTINRDRKQDINNVVCVSHGVTDRSIIQQWMHYKPEWFIKEPNPGNCWVRLIEGNKQIGYTDHGYIYTGKMEEIEALEKKAGILKG